MKNKNIIAFLFALVLIAGGILGQLLIAKNQPEKTDQTSFSLNEDQFFLN